MLKHLSLIFLLFLSCAQIAFSELLCGTWNLKWFPSGLANRRQRPSVEQAHIKQTGQFLAFSLKSLSLAEEDEIILFFQEVRDAQACDLLLAATGLSALTLSVISDFKDQAKIPLWQQLCLASTLPVIESGCVVWEPSANVMPPRGYIYAVYDWGSQGKIVCFCLHLKSNLNWSGQEIENQENIYKRELASQQVLDKLRELRVSYGSDLRAVVAGDFNTDDEDGRFVSEATIRSFYGAHFRSCFTGMAVKERVTCPGGGFYPDATFDYILYRGFGRLTERRVFPSEPLSDHHLVVIKVMP